MSPITIAQTILGALLIIAILLQQRGSGLGASLGGDSSSYATRRGAEKIIFTATIIVAILWIGVSIVRLLV